MKTNDLLKKGIAVMMVAALGFTFSCQENESPYAEEASYVAEEAVTDYYFEDADDMAGIAVASDEGTAGGKTSAASGVLDVIDDRFCAQVLISFDEISTLLHPVGSIVIDFGDGCEDPRGNVRSGKIRVDFDGARFLPGSSIVITFEDYVINGIELSGTRTLTNITGSNEESPKFQIELENGLAVWPDGSEASRAHCFIRTWNRGVLNNASDDVLIVTQCDQEFAATGVNRRGKSYTMTIEEDLIYKRGCPIAVQGQKIFDIDGKVITVDYGNGSCDAVITIAVDGNSSRVNVRRRG